MKYGGLNLGQVEAIVNKLGGMDGVRRFLAGELVAKVAERTFAIWKTIKLGVKGLQTDDFQKALEEAGCEVSDWASDILGKPTFTVSETEMDVDLVVVSNVELGFRGGAKFKDIYACAKELGLELCPAEVGPGLRLQYKDQPKGEGFIVAMEPIIDSYGRPLVFRVEHNDEGLLLHGHYGRPDYSWDGDDRFVFRLRK